MEPTLVVGYDGMGLYGIFVISLLLKLAYTECKVEWSNVKSPHLVVRSHFDSIQHLPDFSCPYITWSGEILPVKNKSHLPLFHLDTVHKTPTLDGSIVSILKYTPSFHVPYAVNYITERNMFAEIQDSFEAKTPKALTWADADFEPSPAFGLSVRRLKALEPRPYLCVYLSKNPVLKREQLFAALVKRVGDRSCHSLGVCQNNLEKIRAADEKIYEHVCTYAREQNYRKNTIILKNYRFAMVMENENACGYITEKIMLAFKAGCIPIYWGGGTKLAEYFNPRSFVNVSEFKSIDECVDYVLMLDGDQERIGKMRAESVFPNDKVPDIFRGLQSQQFRGMAKYLRSSLPHPSGEQTVRECRNKITGMDSIYWINLERCPIRRARMLEILNPLSIPNERIVATEPTPDLIPNNFVFNGPPRKQPNQYATLLSHLRAIFRFLYSDAKIVLVLEDDISLDFIPYWHKSVQQIIDEAPADWEIIMLSYTSLQEVHEPYLHWRCDRASSTTHRHWTQDFNGATAYLINKRGAQSIISRLWADGKWKLDDTFCHVSDEIIYGHSTTYVYKFPFFTWPDDNDTTLGDQSYLNFHMAVKKVHKLRMTFEVMQRE